MKVPGGAILLTLEKSKNRLLTTLCLAFRLAQTFHTSSSFGHLQYSHFNLQFNNHPNPVSRMNQSKESSQSFVQQKRADDKKDRSEVCTHSRIFGGDHTESVAKVPKDKVDDDGRKASIPGGIPSGQNDGGGRPGAGVGPAFDNMKDSGPGQRVQSSTEHTTSRLDWPPQETTKGKKMNPERNVSSFWGDEGRVQDA